MPRTIPLICRDNVGTGFLVSDGSSVWLTTCVHLVSGQLATSLDPVPFQGAEIRMFGSNFSIPLYDGCQRFAVIDSGEEMLLDALAIKLGAVEIEALSHYGCYDKTSIRPPAIDETLMARGYAGIGVDPFEPPPETAYVGRVTQLAGPIIALSNPSIRGWSGAPLFSEKGLAGIMYGDRGTYPKLTSALAVSFSVVGDLLFR